jgi:CBS domain/BON domain
MSHRKSDLGIPCPRKICQSSVSVRPNARVEEVASILLASRISAVPVIDEQGELLGIVSEGETPPGQIATLLEKNRIKRVPIVQNGKVVGIVSRANLLQALATMSAKDAPSAHADDAEIRDKVLSRLNAEPWRPSLLSVTVYDGNVDLWGFVTSNDEKKAADLATSQKCQQRTLGPLSIAQTIAETNKLSFNPAVAQCESTRTRSDRTMLLFQNWRLEPHLGATRLGRSTVPTR